MRSVVLVLVLAVCVSDAFLQRITSSPPPYSLDYSLNDLNASYYDTTRHWLDVVYPMRRYHSPPLGPLPDPLHGPPKGPPQYPDYYPPQYPQQQPPHDPPLETGTYMTYVHPVHLTNPWRRRVSMRKSVDSMMDRLLSVRRLPGGGDLHQVE